MFLMAVGFGVLLIGPMMQVHYQGIGDKPISFELSDAWQRASYVLMPIGASIVVLAGIVLAVIDRKPRPEG